MPGGLYAPLEVTQSWPAPNYDNPELRPKTLVILAYILGPLTVCLCFVRFWVRTYHQKSTGPDDWLMLASIVSLLWHPHCVFCTDYSQPFTITLTALYPLGMPEPFFSYREPYN